MTDMLHCQRYTRSFRALSSKIVELAETEKSIGGLAAAIWLRPTIFVLLMLRHSGTVYDPKYEFEIAIAANRKCVEYLGWQNGM